jgi:hypothetical protein
MVLEFRLPNRSGLLSTVFLLVLLAVPFAVSLAQESCNKLPAVTEHAAIVYPPLARQARIQGVVRMQVRTNGHVVIEVAITQGHPLLAQSADQNVRTWKFVDHVPATFDVTFNFGLLENTRTFLQQPGLVQVVGSPEGGISSYTLPEKWNAKVRNPQGTIDTTLTLWTYHSFEEELDGYTTGPQGQERDIREPHIDGDMLGFDARLDDKYGQRLKFSMIGKRTGDKIEGVFLNYWGQGGTWTAERAAKTVSEAGSAQTADPDEIPITGAGVAYHEYPEYSRFAIDAGIQGTVQLRVATDGHSVTKVDAESGNPFLIRSAIENLRTWRYANHNPRTFDVTYTYQLLDGIVEFLKEPGVVEIESVPPLVIVDNDQIYIPPDIWQMQLKSSRGSTGARLSLMMPNDWPDGYLTGDVVGPAWRKEEIRQAHRDGDMFGFDATVGGPDGRPLRISALGKKTGNKITGVFLDYAGTPGTWTAVPQPSHPKPTR